MGGFPDITPPTVQVSAVYPGANAQTVAQTVGIPIEQQVNGVEGMLYMSSNSSSSGAYSLTITFAVGTDIDMATVQVQNRVSVAQASLPTPVVVQGVTVQKQSSNIVMFLTMTSENKEYDGLYLSNYATLNLVDQLTRVPGVGAVNVMGAGDYSMRIWLDPAALRIRNLSAADVYQAIQSQNVEVSAGAVGQPLPGNPTPGIIITILTEDLTEYNFIDDINPEDKNKLKLVLLNEFLEQKNITNIQELQYNSEYLKELAVTMNKRYKFTQKEIAELVGLSRLKIHRLMNE